MMQQNAQIQRLGINQIALLNSFFSMKLEILSVLLENQGEDELKEIRCNLRLVDDNLRNILTGLDEIRGKNTASSEMKRRGLCLYFSNVRKEIEQIMHKLGSLECWFVKNNQDLADELLIGKEIQSLCEIIESSHQLIGDKVKFS